MECHGSSDKINPGDGAWMMIGAALVFIMTPGLSFFYGGMAKKYFVPTLLTCLLCMATVTVQWFLFGYSLVFSTTGSSFLGDFGLSAFSMNDDRNTPHCNAPTIPENVYMFYELMFAIITPALAFGAGAANISLHGFIIWVFAWSTLVYDPVAYWTWNPNGWLRKLGALDYAGGGPVHLASGTAALAYALLLSRTEERNPQVDEATKTHDRDTEAFSEKQSSTTEHQIAYVLIGTILLWFGWFGFNGGSEGAANGRAGNALIVTMIAPCVGGLVWIFAKREFICFNFCIGVVCGLVTITPGAGYVTSGAAFIFGIVGPGICCLALRIKPSSLKNDPFDVFAIHGIGGFVGCILTGLFAADKVWHLNSANLDSEQGGWWSERWKQIGYQIAAVLSIAAWSFCVSFLLMFIIKTLLIVRDPHDPWSLGMLAGPARTTPQTTTSQTASTTPWTPIPGKVATDDTKSGKGVEMQTIFHPLPQTQKTDN